MKQPYQLYFQRIDPGRNMARYYVLSLQPTLFGDISLVRSWGRIGKSGCQKVDFFASEREAVVSFLDLTRVRRARGYRPVNGTPLA